MKGRRKDVNGYTMIELLTTIAIITIIVSLVAPALNRARHSAKAVECGNNMHQMVRGLFLYAADNRDWLPPNPEDGHTNAWVQGSMSDRFDATNTLLLTDPRSCKLAPYVPTAKTFKCPSDPSFVMHSGIKRPRVRTVSMNQAIGTKPTAPIEAVDGVWLDGTRGHKRNQPFRTFGQMADIIAPSPADLWVFTDEDYHLINDAAFAVTMIDPPAIIDWPGTYHNNGGSFAFADGHSEIHRWKDSRTKIPVDLLKNNIDDYTAAKVQPGNPDIIWLRARTSSSALPQ